MRNDNISQDNNEKMTFKSVMKEWVIPLAVEALVLILLIKFVFFLTYIPTGSMLNTIDEHSWLFATRMYNAEENIERGDILVFKSEELNKVLIKRVIGMPGDEVEVKGNGEVFINGALLNEPYVSSESNFSGVFNVPEGEYLFFGDNRGGSVDARYWENPYVSEEDIVGEAHFALWPLTNFGLLE